MPLPLHCAIGAAATGLNRSSNWVTPAWTAGGGGRSVPGKQGGGVGDLLLVSEAKFLQSQHVPHLVEGREACGGVGDVIGCGGEAGVEAAEEVQDKLRVLNDRRRGGRRRGSSCGRNTRRWWSRPASWSGNHG